MNNRIKTGFVRRWAERRELPKQSKVEFNEKKKTEETFFQIFKN